MKENKIAVSITANTLTQILVDILRVNELADLIEIRLDYLQDKDLYQDSKEILKATIEVRQKPLIFTYRSGKKESVPNRNIQSISRLLGNRTKDLGVDYFDFDLSANNTTTFHLYSTYQHLFGQSAKIILSHHDFENCDSEELFSVYNRLATLTPEVIKIASKASRLTDQLTIFSLLEMAQKENLNLIALAMGEAGQISRILAPSYGSFLTFAALEKGLESAPGQFTLEEMHSLYRVKSVNQETKFYCLLGCPVGHSLSPHMHNAALMALGENGVYIPVSVPINELPEFVEKFLHPKTRQMKWSFAGASVTVPHKIAIQGLLDEIDPIAKEIGAVNTIVVKEERLIGYNTDVLGAIAPLKTMLNLTNAKVAILGAGGAARAVVAGLKREGANIIVYGRDEEKLSYLIKNFGVIGKHFAGADKLSCDLLINTTPIGMSGWQSESQMPINPEALKNCDMVYDLVYNPLVTPLLQEARKQGLPILSGLEMLIAQAVEQLKLWTGLEPSSEIMRNAALKKLS